MTRTLTIPARIALDSNTDLEGHISFRDPTIPSAPVLDDMKFVLLIKYSDGGGGTSQPIKISDVLTGQTLTDFRSALASLRDAAFDISNIPDV